MAKYTKNILVLKPFFEKAFSIAKIKPIRIRRVVGYSVPLDRAIQQGAQITHWGSGYYTISLCITEAHYKNLGKKNFRRTKNTKYSLAFMLDSIAHEVSHIKHWEHDGNHMRLQARILSAFAIMVNNLKITDTSKSYDKALKGAFDRKTIS
jgi:hypothetical protein